MPEENDFIGKFRLIRKLGEGGMGSVYLAQDQRVKPPRMVAIKMLRDNNPEFRERFGREVGIIANFEHPNIVHVFEVDEHEGHPFMAMAYVKGETLLEMIRRKAPMPLLRKLQIIEHLCAGLAYAHRQGVVHRDIKPGNVMVDSEETLKILDFGIAKLADSTLTVSGSLIGTPNYMSPEQIMGEAVGPQSDIFAVGCLSYQILAYQQAFPGKIPEVLGRIQYQEPVPLRDTPAALDGPIAEIIERALKKNPAERYQDLADMQRDIAKVRKRLEETTDDKTVVEPRLRQVQVEPLLAAARDALSGGDFAGARARAAEILQSDTSNTEALAIDRSAHAALVEVQSRDLILKARTMLAAENVTGADDLVQQIVRQSPNHPEVMKLRAEIASRRQRQEEDVAQRRAIARSITRARTHLAEGAFEAASRALDEVFALVPKHEEALKLAEDAKARRTPDATVLQAATEARQHLLETIRVDVNAALDAHNAELAERLARELAESGADPKEIADIRTRIVDARQQKTIAMAPPVARQNQTPSAVATPAPRTLTESDKMARAGLRAFYHGDYGKALEVLERIPKTAEGSVTRERVVFYMACSNAALGLLEGAAGTARLDKARKLYQLAQPEKNPFANDRKYISPEIIGALEGTSGKALAEKA